MQVDVIIPAHNPGGLLHDALESCVQQTYKNFKVYVIDDCSTENLKPVIKRFSKSLDITFIQNKKNMGPSGTRNAGIKASNGELISFLDADDIWHPRKLELSVREFKKDPDAAMTCGNYQILVHGRLRSPFYKKPISVNWKTLMKINYVASGSVTVKRSVFENIGLFDESLWIAEDYDGWIRLAEGHKINYIHEVLYYYRIIPGGDSLTQRDDIQKNHIDNLNKIKKASLDRLKLHERMLNGKTNREEIKDSD